VVLCGRAKVELESGGADENLDYQEVVHVFPRRDRIRAVELYFKLGKRVRPTIRQLGLERIGASTTCCARTSRA